LVIGLSFSILLVIFKYSLFNALANLPENAVVNIVSLFSLLNRYLLYAFVDDVSLHVKNAVPNFNF
jgi:hypothetical protein